MNGFLVSKNVDIEYNSNDYKIICYKIGTDKYTFVYKEQNKFKNDCLFFENDNYVILLDGVILNKNELERSEACGWRECFIKLLENNHEMMRDLRGSFRGVILFKKDGKLLAFTNQTGEKTVYYSSYGTGEIIFTHIEFAMAILGNREWVKPNIQSSWELLLTGSVLSNKSPFEGVNRIEAGTYCLFDNGECEVKRYHIFKNIPEHNMSLDECVEEAYKLFQQAITRIFEKSKEYGYRFEADLSGGIDSRLVNFSANSLGYNNVLNLCYATEGSLDNEVSKEISKDLGNEYIFYPMDEKVLFDIDRKTRITGGQVLYCMSTGAYNNIQTLEDRNVGLTCMGLLGEMQKADWVHGNNHERPCYISNRKSYYYKLNIPDDYSNKYDNYEQMALYEYGFKLILMSVLTRQTNFEIASPFLDTDYLEFVFKIPLKYRKNYLFVEKMVITKYKNAAKYVWQTVRMPVTNHYYKRIYLPKIKDDVVIFSKRAINKIARNFGVKYRFIKKDDMNPFDAWVFNNKDVRKKMDEYYSEGISLIRDDILREKVSEMYEKTNLGTDKIQVLNLIALWKNYFSNNC